MRFFILDPAGLAPTPEGAVAVARETDFLRNALNNATLLVRTEELCQWAERYARALNISVMIFRSPIEDLRAAFPELGEAEAKQLALALGDSLLAMERPLRGRSILQALYPMPLWDDQPKPAHGARWLIWLAETVVPPWLEPVLMAVAQEWREQTVLQHQVPYTCVQQDSARRTLDSWIGALEPWEGSTLGEFPLPVPDGEATRVLQHWTKLILQSRGSVFPAIARSSSPILMKRKAAVAAVKYYKGNPAELTLEIVNRLASFLDDHQLLILREVLPPATPLWLDFSEHSQVLRWFVKSYMPWRLWQWSHGDDQAHAVSLAAAEPFERWYLNAYGSALAASTPMANALSFARSAQIAEEHAKSLTLVVIFDGLHVADASILRRHVQELVPQLSLLKNDLVFAPLPTVTEFCKPALIYGEPPVWAVEHSKTGTAPPHEVIAENGNPSIELRQAQPGQTWFWRLTEPDNTYHWQNSSASLAAKVSATLYASAKMISAIVEQVPSSLLLRIICTSDHGRLLGKSIRRLDVPAGYTSHGRAAWGDSAHDYGEAGYVIRDSQVWLSAERFGLPSHAVVAFDESSYRTNDDKTGAEDYAHGGLFPEEVIVPWLVYGRDVDPPVLMVRLLGSGVSGTRGDAWIEVQNTAEFPVGLEELSLGFGGSPPQLHVVGVQIPPLNTARASFEVVSWPAERELAEARAIVHFSLADGRRFQVNAMIQLTVSEMYRRNDDILSDLP